MSEQAGIETPEPDDSGQVPDEAPPPITCTVSVQVKLPVVRDDR